jgi:ribulose-5-phosphate 4-epimerase/fuculose-1-phosphate aldolase
VKVIVDGIIKYNRKNFTHISSIPDYEYQEIESIRHQLFKMNLIGEDPIHKIGFGNISMRMNYSKFLQTPNSQFIISGSQTGKHPQLNGTHYTRILDFNTDSMELEMMGAIEASSETLTHAAIYQSCHEINFIIHIHSKSIWNNMKKNNYPFIPENIEYGTKEMANEVAKLSFSKSSGIMSMNGHEDGVISYGKNSLESFEQIKHLFIKFGN